MRQHLCRRFIRAGRPGLGPDGLLYVAEETAGVVSQVGPTGNITPVLAGLSSPEGIAFDDQGNLFVVEDVANGRLIRRTPAGVTTTLAGGLDAPEGVVAAADGTIYLTESNAQLFINDPTQWKSRVTAVDAGGTVTRLITTTPVLNGFNVEFLSFSGLTLGADGLLYVANETAGAVVIQPPYTLTTTKSIITVNPTTAADTLFSEGLIGPEGLRFADAGQFPLYVAGEDVSGGDQGQLSQVASDGSSILLCAGFGNMEDVIVDHEGRLYVSDDTNGRIVQLGQGSANIYFSASYSKRVIKTTSSPLFFRSLYFSLATGRLFLLDAI